jgi:hypothetical protein
MPERLEIIAALDTLYAEVCARKNESTTEGGNSAIAEFLRLVHYVGVDMRRYH